MGSLNKVMLIGNLGRDAEMRYTSNGTAVATLNMATTEKWKDRQGAMQEKTEWHRVTVWGKTAEALQAYLVKGKQIFVEGRLQTRQWEKDGVKRYTTEVVADRITLLGSGAGRSNGAPSRRDDDALGGDAADFGTSGSGNNGGAVTPITDDDIPF